MRNKLHTYFIIHLINIRLWIEGDMQYINYKTNAKNENASHPKPVANWNW